MGIEKDENNKNIFLSKQSEEKRFLTGINYYLFMIIHSFLIVTSLTFNSRQTMN